MKPRILWFGRAPGILAKEAGYSFLELLLAVTVLALVMVPVFNMFLGSHTVLLSAGKKTAAANLCREKIETIKAGGYLQAYRYYVEGERSPEVDVPGDPSSGFIRKTVVTPVTREIPREECENENEEEVYKLPLLKIQVKVSWEESDTVRSVEVESYLAPR